MKKKTPTKKTPTKKTATKKTPTKKRAKKSTKATTPRSEKTTTPPAVIATKMLQDLPEFPIVGIGASAGGLEALEHFLDAVPSNSGMAFVIVQHLDPTHKGMMAELLQRTTEMKVIQVKDRTKVEPNCVYVIPPNKDMSILNGMLHLLTPAKARGLRLPIDSFFRSLAQDRREHSIGVILSGMGSDGSLGLHSIKEMAGVVFVQDPSDAKFDGMPSSAIDAGLADIICPVVELPGKIIAYLKRTTLMPHLTAPAESKAISALEKIIILLRAHTGHDFSLYKQTSLFRRIERRMGIHQIPLMSDYVRYLQENSQELSMLFKELLIGVTNFFRDPHVWDKLRDESIPALLNQAGDRLALRAWVTGCSTGEEAYTLGIAFQEAMETGKFNKNFTLQIFATDLDQDAIEKARTGIFPDNIAVDVSSERLKKYFVKQTGGYRVGKKIREMVIFAPHNITMDAPFTKLDILSCRNLLIYLTQKVQKKLIPLFHYSLNPGGLLVLGSSETIGTYSNLFNPSNGKTRIYTRDVSNLLNESVDFPASFSSPAKVAAKEIVGYKKPDSMQTMADHLILQQYAPPSVLCNDQGDILYITGHTGKYLEPAAGKANWNIFAMSREGLRYELSAAFHKVLNHKDPIELQNLRIEDPKQEHFVDVKIHQIAKPEAIKGLVLVVFYDVPAPFPVKTKKLTPGVARDRRIKSLEQDLAHVRSEEQSTNEAMQTLQEEYRSANEELQSTNEELQSTNEELTTSKEEMQSLNEELQSLNAELQTKLDELSSASSDMKNLLNSTDIAIIFLDKHLNVRRFTPQATHVVRLIPGDIGRPITDLATTLHYPELANDAREVIRTLVSRERVLSAPEAHWLNMRIIPYRTLDDRIDGVVITFTDISIAKKLEQKLLKKTATAEQDLATEIEKTGGGIVNKSLSD